MGKSKKVVRERESFLLSHSGRLGDQNLIERYIQETGNGM